MPRVPLTYLMSCLCVTALSATPLCVSAVADDWPQWLGPNHASLWKEAGIVTELPAEGLKVLWTVPVAAGYSGPAVADGRVFVADHLVPDPATIPADPFSRAAIPGSERILCCDDATGKLLWKYEYDCPYTISYPLGPRATPTVQSDGKGGGQVYTLGSMGHLACLDVATGSVIWKKELTSEYGVKAPLWGFAAHPLVDGDNVITLVGGPAATVVAFDRMTGNERWRSLTSKEIGYCPPVIYEAGGVRQLIIFDPEATAALDPATGKVLWSVPIEPSYAMSIAMPRKAGDELFVTAYQNVSMLLELSEATPAAQPLWRGNARIGVDCTMMTPWFEDGHIYGCDSGGSFCCVRASDGKQLWKTAKPVTGDRPAKSGNAFVVKHQPSGVFFLFNEQGDLITADLSPEGYHERSRTHLIDPTSTANGRPVLWMHPAFANQSVYARNDTQLVKVSLAASPAAGK